MTRAVVCAGLLAAALAAATGRANAQVVPSGEEPAPAPVVPPQAPDPPAAEPAQPDDVRTLRSELSALHEEVARLRERDKPAPPSYRLWWDGYVQADWVAVRQSSLDEINPSTGEPLNEKRFVIPRARLSTNWERGPIVGIVQIDANTVAEPILRPVIVNGSYRWFGRDKDGPPLLMLTAGLFRTPFGFELTQPFRDRLFIDQTEVVRSLFPGIYDLGVWASGGYAFLRYSLAAMNGAPLGDRQFPGRDPSESKDVMGRLGVDSEVARNVRARVGLSWLTGHGFHRAKAPTKDSVQWRDFNEDGQVDVTELQSVPGTPGEASQIFPRFVLGLDAGLTFRMPVLGETFLYGELMVAKNADRSVFTAADPIASARDLRELGYYLAITQEITRYGMAGMKYEHYDPDRDASEQRVRLVPLDRSSSRWAFALAGRYASSRLIVEYAHVTNARARDASGAPTRLRDDSLTVRWEVGFP